VVLWNVRGHVFLRGESESELFNLLFVVVGVGDLDHLQFEQFFMGGHRGRLQLECVEFVYDIGCTFDVRFEVFIFPCLRRTFGEGEETVGLTRLIQGLVEVDFG